MEAQASAIVDRVERNAFVMLDQAARAVLGHSYKLGQCYNQSTVDMTQGLVPA